MKEHKKIALAPMGIFWSPQGEGHLRGVQMIFLRTAGCSVGCWNCDTDYSVDTRKTIDEIVGTIDGIIDGLPRPVRDPWVWITGGEPADRDLTPLIHALRGRGYLVAVATSGVHRISDPVDWLSVSPHSSGFVQRFGHEAKIIDDLNGARLEELADEVESADFFFRYVQPVTLPDGTECPESLARCLEFLRGRPDWALSRQDHRIWGVA
jgi:organic radical activating enzyme